MTAPAESCARLLVTCADRSGIVAAVTGFLHRHGANITDLDQHSSDPADGTFFLRLEFQTPGLDVGLDDLRRGFEAEVAATFVMQWRMTAGDARPRTAILASRHDHCLMELLWQWSRHTLPIDVRLVVSNHPDLRDATKGFGVRFEHVPNSGDGAAEARMLELMGDDVELVVLARYMRVLSADFVGRYAGRMINIHHSFLPAFRGGDPYRQAHAHGVKLIGATAHYVTANLDAGPIIGQDTVRVTHRDDVEDLKRMGRDLERQVLARAVRWQAEERIIVDDNKTVVFS